MLRTSLHATVFALLVMTAGSGGTSATAALFDSLQVTIHRRRTRPITSMSTLDRAVATSASTLSKVTRDHRPERFAICRARARSTRMLRIICDATARKDTGFLTEMNTRAKGEGVTQVLIMVDGEGNLGDPDGVKQQTAVENRHKVGGRCQRPGLSDVRVN